MKSPQRSQQQPAPQRFHRPRLWLCLIGLSAGFNAPQTLASVCDVMPLQNSNRFPDESLGDRVILSADSAESDPTQPENIRLNGTIEILHKGGAIQAENALYNANTNRASVDGDMTYESAGLRIHSADAEIDIADGTFRLGESGYEVTSGDVLSQGRAGEIRRDSDGALKLNSASYSSCPPGDNGWRLTASQIKLDGDEGVGTARDVTLRFKNVPLLYTPIFSFPISNQRKTGLLPPRFDQSDQTGFEYRQPFYWNIRPNWDATFVMRAMTDRGIQLQSELRHLNRIGNWTLNHEAILDDRRFAPGETRRFSRFQHEGDLGAGWTTEMDLSSVSDKDYFEDLGDTLKIASITHLQRRADLNFKAPSYNFRARLLSYQTVDLNIAEDERPYRKLPQLTFSYKAPVKRLGLTPTLDAELVYFDRSGGSVTGSRLDIKPRISWDINRPGWFTNLASTWRVTRYDLNNVTGQDQAQVRNVPLFSADAGLYFQRRNPTGNSMLTLEPRLFYLYAKRREQQRLPVFDTGALDFNFSQLFRENRFSGADRINDANQLSFALSSRLINMSGRENFAASVGQIFYFEDRLVTLPEDNPGRSSTSDIVAEFSAVFNRRWSSGLNMQWNPTDGSTERSSARINYNNGPDKLVNFGHRYLADDGEFAHFSFTWPIANRWRLASGWNYSLDDNKGIETVLGIEYESCCWAFRTAARRYITDDGEDSTDAYFFQLVLKGLAPVGQNVTEVLSEAIGGYRYSP
jgi:LPS-assembly protein